MNRSLLILSATLWLGSCSQDNPVEPATLNQPVQATGMLKAHANADGFQLELITTPSPIPLNQDFTLRFRLLDGNGSPLTDPLTQIALDADMPEHGHGMKVAPTLEEKDGWIHASPLLFHMPGLWEIYVDRKTGHVTERAQLSFKVF